MDTAQEYDVSMSFKHGFYKPNDHTNDIGMLRLESRVTYTGEFPETNPSRCSTN